MVPWDESRSRWRVKRTGSAGAREGCRTPEPRMMREHVPRLALVALGTLPVDPPATAGVIQRRSPARHATIPAHSPSARRTRTRRAVEDEFTRLPPRRDGDRPRRLQPRAFRRACTFVAGETELPRARCLNLRMLIPDVNTALFICCNSTVARSHDASPTRRPRSLALPVDRSRAVRLPWPQRLRARADDRRVPLEAQPDGHAALTCTTT